MGKKRESAWISGADLAALVGCSAEHIKRLRQRNELKARHHWIALNPKAAAPRFRYHRQRCQRYFEEMSEA